MATGDSHFDRPVALGSTGMVAASNETAAAVGRDVLAAGGNAIDAAIAVSFTLGAVEAFHSGIGGGAFVNYYQAASGRVWTLDARGVAPAAAREDMFLRDGEFDWDAAVIGHRSVVVPGLVAGLDLAHRRWGSLPLPELVEPAARLAEQGFEVTPIAAFKCNNPVTLRALQAHPAAARLYLRDGQPLAAGERLSNPDLARSYRLIGRHGAEAFYRGEIGRAIVAEMQQGGGLITQQDLAGYHPRELPPLRGSYRGHEVVTMPPPSGGGAFLLQALGLVEAFDLAAIGRDDPLSLHLLAEAMKLAFADRRHYLGDPDFVSVPLETLLSADYLDFRRRLISVARALSEVRPGPVAAMSGPRAVEQGSANVPLDGGTTSFAIADRFGNLLALTQTIGMNLGSGVVVPGTGIVLNHTMSDFSPAPGTGTAWGFGTYTSRANAIAPGKAPLSSMAPTLVFREGRPWLAVGAAGGTQIPTTVLQVVVNVIDFGDDIQAAISAPRIHDQDAGLGVERFRFAEVQEPLESLGHDLVRLSDYHDAMSSWAQGVVVVDGDFQGGADPRADGAAFGLSA